MLDQWVFPNTNLIFLCYLVPQALNITCPICPKKIIPTFFDLESIYCLPFSLSIPTSTHWFGEYLLYLLDSVQKDSSGNHLSFSKLLDNLIQCSALIQMLNDTGKRAVGSWSTIAWSEAIIPQHNHMGMASKKRMKQGNHFKEIIQAPNWDSLPRKTS